MPIITPDLSGIGPIEPGTYEAEWLSGDYKTSKAGNPMLVGQVGVTVGDKVKNRIVNLVLEGPGAFSFDQLLRACHLDEIADHLKDPNADHSFDTDVLVGQKFHVVVEEQIYNGNKQDQIKTYLRA
jgi:hypothetical protein